jgi:YidC/Oxa1 family membrane protein insertase
MDIRRFMLFSALGLVGYLMVNAWSLDYPSAANTTKAQPVTHAVVNSEPNPLDYVPAKSKQQAQLIDIKSDVLSLQVDLSQGDVVSANLLAYPVSLAEKNTPFPLLMNKKPGLYVAGNQLFALDQENKNALSLHFQSKQTHYELAPGQSQLIVTLDGQDEHGLKIQKQFIISKGSYVVEVRYVLHNTNASAWQGYLNTHLLRESPAEDKSSLFHVGSYTGASYSNPGVHRYQKVTFKDMSKANLDQTVTGGWFAMQQRYFLTAWILNTADKSRLYTRAYDDQYVIGSVSPVIHLDSHEEKTIGLSLYLGPEIANELSKVSPGLDLTIDYGWLWFISSLLFSVMTAIYSVLGNWGWAIVLVTALVKLLFYRLSATSYRSMAAMRNLQPKMQALRERYGDDKAKMSQATMELYRQEKINPLAGCLPLVIQIPVMIALYWVMIESVQLRQAPFILWIHDLALADPWHVLPILMGITMLIQQRLNPAPPDPMQARVMMFLPVLFTGLFWNFPAGLVLYWTVNNSLTLLQQWHITRKYNAA